MSRLSKFLSQFLLQDAFSYADVWNYRTLYYFGMQQYKGTPSFVSLIVDNETDKKYIKINSESFSDDNNSFLYHELYEITADDYEKIIKYNSKAKHK